MAIERIGVAEAKRRFSELADRVGRVRVTSLAMAISGLCCLAAGPLFGAAPVLTVAVSCGA